MNSPGRDGIARSGLLIGSSGPAHDLHQMSTMLFQIQAALKSIEIDSITLVDPSRTQIETELMRFVTQDGGGFKRALTLYLAGHATGNRQDVTMQLTDGSNILLGEVLQHIRTNASASVVEILILLDTCASGLGTEVVRRLSESDEGPPLVLIPSSIGRAVAYSGVFSHAFTSAVAAGNSRAHSLYMDPRAIVASLRRDPLLARLELAAPSAQVKFIALMNPSFEKRDPWYQAEQDDKHWRFCPRPLLEEDLRRRLRDVDRPSDSGSDGGTVTLLTGPDGSGKSTMLRWIARNSDSADLIETGSATEPLPLLFVDCRELSAYEVQRELVKQLGSTGDDYQTLLDGIHTAGAVRIMLDEVEDDGEISVFSRKLAADSAARIVLASSQEYVADQRVDVASDKYYEETEQARRDLAVALLGSASGLAHPGFVDQLLTAANGSFLLVYLYSRSGASQPPSLASAEVGIGRVLFDFLLDGVEHRLRSIECGDQPIDAWRLVRPLALAEGDGLPTVELWADLAGYRDLFGNSGMLEQILDALGPSLDIRANDVGLLHLRLQSAVLAGAAQAREAVGARQADIVDYLVQALSEHSAYSNMHAIEYAREHVPEHLRRAGLLGRLEDGAILTRVLPDRAVRALEKDGSERSRRLAAAIRSWQLSSTRSHQALALTASAYRFPELAASLAGNAEDVSISWQHGAPHIRLWRSGNVVLTDSPKVAPWPAGRVYVVETGGRAIMDVSSTEHGGSLIATSDGRVLLWTPAAMLSGRPLAEVVRGIGAPILSVGTTGDYLVIATTHGRIHRWARSSGEELDELHVPGLIQLITGSDGALITLTTSEIRAWASNNSSLVAPPPTQQPFERVKEVRGDLFLAVAGSSLWHFSSELARWALVMTSGSQPIQFDVATFDDQEWIAYAISAQEAGMLRLCSGSAEKVWSIDVPIEVSDVALSGPGSLVLATPQGLAAVDPPRSGRPQK